MTAYNEYGRIYVFLSRSRSSSSSTFATQEVKYLCIVSLWSIAIQAKQMPLPDKSLDDTLVHPRVKRAVSQPIHRHQQ